MSQRLDTTQLRGVLSASAPIPAGLARRLAAFCIDLVTYYMIVVAALTLTVLKATSGQEGLLVLNAWDYVDVVGWSAVVGPLVLLVVRDLTWGRSFGKWLAGIRVVEADSVRETTPAVGALVLRNLTLFILPVEVVVLVAGALAGLVGAGGQNWWSRGRTLGDLLAGAWLAEEIPPPNRPTWARTLTKGSAAAVVCLAFLVLVQAVPMTVVRHSVPYRLTESFIRDNAQVDELVGAGAAITQRFSYGPVLDEPRLIGAGAVIRGQTGTVSLSLVFERPPLRSAAGGRSGWAVVDAFYMAGPAEYGALTQGVSCATPDVAGRLTELRAQREQFLQNRKRETETGTETGSVPPSR